MKPPPPQKASAETRISNQESRRQSETHAGAQRHIRIAARAVGPGKTVHEFQENRGYADKVIQTVDNATLARVDRYIGKDPEKLADLLWHVSEDWKDAGRLRASSKNGEWFSQGRSRGVRCKPIVSEVF